MKAFCPDEELTIPQSVPIGSGSGLNVNITPTYISIKSVHLPMGEWRESAGELLVLSADPFVANLKPSSTLASPGRTQLQGSKRTIPGPLPG